MDFKKAPEMERDIIFKSSNFHYSLVLINNLFNNIKKKIKYFLYKEHLMTLKNTSHINI